MVRAAGLYVMPMMVCTIDFLRRTGHSVKGFGNDNDGRPDAKEKWIRANWQYMVPAISFLLLDNSEKFGQYMWLEACKCGFEGQFTKWRMGAIMGREAFVGLKIHLQTTDAPQLLGIMENHLTCAADANKIGRILRDENFIPLRVKILASEIVPARRDKDSYPRANGKT